MLALIHSFLTSIFKYRHYKFFLLFSCLLQNINAQYNIQPPNYIPQSPAAATYSRYGEIPVDYSTGVPRIEVPIYTIKVGETSIPITISYHASGIKVKDIASEVGLGWVLNIGGVVTANILGGPDVISTKPFDYKQTSDVNNLISNASTTSARIELSKKFYLDLEKQAYIQRDGYYHGDSPDYYSDRFQYSLVTGESGIFRKDYVNDSIRFLPYHPVKVYMEPNAINITSPNGVRSFFNQASSNYDLYLPVKIVSNNKTDSLLYFYNHSNNYVVNNIRSSFSWTTALPSTYTSGDCFYVYPSVGMGNPGSSDAGYSGPSTTTVTLPDSIVSKDVVICFKYINDRVDMGVIGNNRLSKIIVKSKYTGNIISTYQLFQSYFGSSASKNLRLKLDSVAVSGSTSINVERYKFNYNSLTLPPYPSLEGNNLAFSEDYWGYYNGKINNGLFPNFMLNLNMPGFDQSLVGDQSPDSIYVKACMLTEISYPTGGKTVFEYESNSRYADAGGLHVRKITSYTDNISQAFVKSYNYGGGVYKTIESIDFGYLDKIMHIVYYNDSHCNLQLSEGGDYESSSASSQSMAPIVNSNGTPIMYSYVEEIFGDGSSNMGKNVYEYNCKKDEESNYANDEQKRPRYINYYHNDYGNYQPLLKSKISYKKEGTNYTPVRSIENTYKIYKSKEFNSGHAFGSNVAIERWGGGSQGDEFVTYCERYSYLSTLTSINTKGHEDIDLLSSTTEWEYSNGMKSLAKVTQYEYDDSTQLCKKTVTSSSNENLITRYKYPYHFSAPGNIYKSMVDRHAISPIIEEIYEKGATPLQTIQTNYSIWPANIITPSSIVTTTGATTYSNLIFNSYDDKGNPTQYTQKDGKIVTLFWAYNKSCPIAKIVSGSPIVNIESLRIEIANRAFDTTGSKDMIINDIAFLRSKLSNFVSDVNYMVELYTYKPLVGMTSATDPRGVTTYYHYDTFNRLLNVKNDDANILNEYKYHYYNQ
jgi:hypothetical protein